MARRGGFFREFIGMLGETKKWWMLPILFVFAILVAFVVLSSTAAAPFIYTLF